MKKLKIHNATTNTHKRIIDINILMRFNKNNMQQVVAFIVDMHIQVFLMNIDVY